MCTNNNIYIRATFLIQFKYKNSIDESNRERFATITMIMQPSCIEDDKIEVILMESSRWEQETSMNEQLKMKALWAHAYVHRMCACYYQIGFGLDHFYSYWKFQTKKKSFPFRFFLQFYFIFFHRCRTMLEMVFFSAFGRERASRWTNNFQIGE